jgi:hypothetical protein
MRLGNVLIDRNGKGGAERWMSVRPCLAPVGVALERAVVGHQAGGTLRASDGINIGA